MLTLTESGTVREIFTFKPHDRLIDISNLEAFLIQYLKPGRLLGVYEKLSTHQLLERGIKY
jgi:hypothetical protein